MVIRKTPALWFPPAGPLFYFELLSSTFFPGLSATFVSASGFGRLKKALILSSTVITHLTWGRVLTQITVMAPHWTGEVWTLRHDFPSTLPQEN